MDLIYIAIMSSAAVFLVLVLIILLEIRLAKVDRKLDSIAKNAQEFVRLGLSHFKSSSRKKK